MADGRRHKTLQRVLASFLIFPVLFGSSGAADNPRQMISFYLIRSDKALKPETVLRHIPDMVRRNANDNFQYIAGGEFTVPPFTDEKFMVRTGDADLDLTLAWMPPKSTAAAAVTVKYTARLSYPHQTYAELANTVALKPGDSVLVSESAAPNGSRSTNPLMVLLEASPASSTYAFKDLGGIGIKLQIRAGYPYVREIIPDGPAAAAGLNINDEIREIDGKSTLQMSLDRTQQLLKGDPGTRVKLKIFRPGRQTIEDASIRRILLE